MLQEMEEGAGVSQACSEPKRSGPKAPQVVIQRQPHGPSLESDRQPGICPASISHGAAASAGQRADEDHNTYDESLMDGCARQRRRQE